MNRGSSNGQLVAIHRGTSLASVRSSGPPTSSLTTHHEMSASAPTHSGGSMYTQPSNAVSSASNTA